MRLKARGQLTLPKAGTESLGLKPGDLARLRVEGGRLIIEPLPPGGPRPVWVEACRLTSLAGTVVLGGDAVKDAEGLDWARPNRPVVEAPTLKLLSQQLYPLN